MDGTKKIKRFARHHRFLLLSALPVYFIVVALFLQPWSEILPGLGRIFIEPDILITDYFVVGGPGPALLNAGVLTLISIWIIHKQGMEMDGHTITSSCLMFGFSLFGKNLLNIWTILLGVYFYARYHKMPFSKYVYVGLYGTSLSPIITQLMYINELPYVIRLVLMLSIGTTIGFVLPPLATHSHYAYNLLFYVIIFNTAVQKQPCRRTLNVAQHPQKQMFTANVGMPQFFCRKQCRSYHAPCFFRKTLRYFAHVYIPSEYLLSATTEYVKNKKLLTFPLPFL